MSKKPKNDARNIKIAVGRRLQMYRNQKEITQEDVAHVADVHPSYITKLETGRANWTIESLDNVLRALDLSYSELFYMIDNPVENANTSVMMQIVRILENQNLEGQTKALKVLRSLFN